MKTTNNKKETFFAYFNRQLNDGDPRRHMYHVFIMLSALLVFVSHPVILAIGISAFRLLMVLSFIISVITTYILYKNENTIYSKNDTLKAYPSLFFTNLFFFALGRTITSSINFQIIMEIEIGLIVAISILVFLVFSIKFEELITEKGTRAFLLAQSAFAFFVILFSLNIILSQSTSSYADFGATFLYYYGIFAITITLSEIIQAELQNIDKEPHKEANLKPNSRTLKVIGGTDKPFSSRM